MDSSSKIDQTRTECDCPTEAGPWSGRSESLPGQVLEHREIMSYNSGRVSCSQANRGRKREDKAAPGYSVKGWQLLCHLSFQCIPHRVNCCCNCGKPAVFLAGPRQGREGVETQVGDPINIKHAFLSLGVFPV